MKVETLPRVFLASGMRLVDPNPALSPQQVLEFYADLYPFLATATVGPGSPANGALEFAIEPAPVKTKG